MKIYLEKKQYLRSNSLRQITYKFTRSPDGMPSAVLRSLSYELCTPLYIMFKTSIDSGECPSLWKYADITPVYKKVDASLASNYRPTLY